MKKVENMGMSKTFTAMVGVTGALVVMLIFMVGTVVAQISIDDNVCLDKCESDTLYLKGVWDDKLGRCVYAIEEPCKYGCKDKLSCSEFPTVPPTNETDFDETLWKMQRSVYDSARIDISTGATEYTLGDNATIFAKVTDLGSPMNDGFCDALIFAPNQTQIAGFSLDYVNNSRGIYSSVYPVPDEYGVYIVDVECFKPFNATNESRFFRRIDSTDKLLNTTSVAVNESLILNQVSLEVLCFERRWTENIMDKQNGNISDYRFLENITNQLGWFGDSSGAAIDYEIFYKFYKVTDKGSLQIGLSLAEVTIGTVITLANFTDAGIEMPFDSTSLLQIEVCCRRVSGANPTDLTFWYNSDYYNSSVMLNTLDYDDPLDFVVGGSSEIHVSDIPYETYLTFATMPEPILLSNHDYCIDNITLGKTLTWEQCLAGRCDNYSRNVTEVCTYGCYEDRCNPEPFDKFLMMMIFLLVVIAIIVVIALVYNKYG